MGVGGVGHHSGMDAFSGQISLFDLDPEMAAREAEWIAAAAAGKPLCSCCGRPVSAQASVDALVGSGCAAKVGRIVIARRNAKAGALAATRRARVSAKRRRRLRDAA